MNISTILKEEVDLIKLDKITSEKIYETSKKFILGLKKNLKKKKINAEVFIGGSLAKNTLIKRKDGKYDVDIFVRFDPTYSDQKNHSRFLDDSKSIKDSEHDKISNLLGKVLVGSEKIHGSRDYYHTKINGITLEIIPVLKIKKPTEAKNVTDLSYFHVNYVLKCTKKDHRINDEIRLAKAFAHANDCYGAESYIKGFSGYALELLICHYKSFIKFVKQVASMDDSKIPLIIDDSKFFKNKKEVLMEMNESKIKSPIILIDPTFKERNALAGLSPETFKIFKKACTEFLKNPSLKHFERKGVFDEFENTKDVKIVSVKTEKQAGDIAGTKSKKFFNFFVHQIERDFVIKKKGFDYDDEKNIAYYYFVLNQKDKEIIQGPPIVRLEALTAFKKAHANAFIKNGFAYIEVTHSLEFEEWLKKFLTKNEKLLLSMSIKEVDIVKN